jgi:hypothetical protein
VAGGRAEMRWNEEEKEKENKGRVEVREEKDMSTSIRA